MKYPIKFSGENRIFFNRFFHLYQVIYKCTKKDIANDHILLSHIIKRLFILAIKYRHKHVNLLYEFCYSIYNLFQPVYLIDSILLLFYEKQINDMQLYHYLNLLKNKSRKMNNKDMKRINNIIQDLGLERYDYDE